MKPFITFKKKKHTHTKRLTALILAAVSCFSLAATPKSAIGSKIMDNVSITAEAAAPYKVIYDTYGSSNREFQRDVNILSHNEKFCVRFQWDGNLVVYRYSYDKANYDALWSSRTSGYKYYSRCIMQADGNLVIYYTPLGGSRRPVWNTQTHGTPRAQLCLADDGELFVRSASTGRKTWSNNVHRAPAASRPFIWPAPNCTGISSCFQDGRNHNAIDIAGYKGASIRAARGGTVVYVNKNCCSHNDPSTPCTCGGHAGNYLTIEHQIDGRTYRTTYMHMTDITVNTGDTVKTNQEIGTMGSTGYSYGWHLDFSIKDSNGTALDPGAYTTIPANLSPAWSSDADSPCCRPYYNTILANRDTIYSLTSYQRFQ